MTLYNPNIMLKQNTFSQQLFFIYISNIGWPPYTTHITYMVKFFFFCHGQSLRDNYQSSKISTSRKHTYKILTTLNPTYI